jgi:hypothetical protein
MSKSGNIGWPLSDNGYRNPFALLNIRAILRTVGA